MLRMCRLKNNELVPTTKEKLYKRLDKCLEKLFNASVDNEGRIQCSNASMKVFVTGKEESVKEYFKFMLRKLNESGCKVTDRPSERINTYAVVLFNLLDSDSEQNKILMEYLSRHRGVSYVFLPYANFTDTVMNLLGDGYYLQLGTKPKISKEEDF